MQTLKSRPVILWMMGALASGLLIACAPSAPPTATPAPPKPAPATAPTQPAAKPTQAPQPTQAAQATVVPKAGLEELTAAERTAVEQFYRGKTFTIVVGFSAGGGYDTYSRLLARNLGKYIPGNPNVIVENRTGAGSLIAANQVYTSGPKDGTAMVMFDQYLVLGQAAGKSGIEFDSKKFNWVGNPAPDFPACAFRSDLGFNTFEEMLKSGKEIVMGATGVGSEPYVAPSAIKAATGANMKIVTGYEGTSRIRLAVENKELDGACWGWSSVKVTAAEWFTGDRPFARVLVQMGRERHRDLPNVPLVREFVKSPEQTKLMDFVDAASEINRPWALPPGVPAERVKAVRLAVVRALNDPDAKAEAEKARLILEPQDYRVLERAIDSVFALPKKDVEAYADLLGLR